MIRQFVSARYKYRRPFRKPLEVFRCETCGALRTNRTLRVGWCAGHRLRQPTVPTLIEFVMIWLGLIR